MKITKRQLRRIIKEEKARLLSEQGNPSLNTYLDWVKEKGHVTPAAASVIATFLVSHGIESLGHMRVLGSEFGIPAEDIRREFDRQQDELTASGGLPQGKEIMESKITKQQLKKIIREEKAKILREQSEMDPKTADAVQLLQTINMNLQDIMANTRGDMYDSLNEQLMLLEDAIHALGAVAS